MRRLLLAAFALVPVAAFLSGCGGTNPAVEEPLVRNTLKETIRALMMNDKDRVAKLVLPTAGQGNNPVGAGSDPAVIHEGNRRLLRQLMVDAGLMKPADLKSMAAPDEAAISRFNDALKVNVVGTNARCVFEIAPEGRKRAEIVTFTMAKDPNSGDWKMYDYSREMKPR